MSNVIFFCLLSSIFNHSTVSYQVFVFGPGNETSILASLMVVSLWSVKEALLEMIVLLNIYIDNALYSFWLILAQSRFLVHINCIVVIKISFFWMSIVCEALCSRFIQANTSFRRSVQFKLWFRAAIEDVHMEMIQSMVLSDIQQVADIAVREATHELTK